MLRHNYIVNFQDGAVYIFLKSFLFFQICVYIMSYINVIVDIGFRDFKIKCVFYMQKHVYVVCINIATHLSVLIV